MADCGAGVALPAGVGVGEHATDAGDAARFVIREAAANIESDVADMHATIADEDATRRMGKLQRIPRKRRADIRGPNRFE